MYTENTLGMRWVIRIMADILRYISTLRLILIFVHWVRRAGIVASQYRSHKSIKVRSRRINVDAAINIICPLGSLLNPILSAWHLKSDHLSKNCFILLELFVFSGLDASTCYVNGQNV